MPETRFRRRVVPDGGWGWVVAAASCVLQIVTNGTVFSFGIIFVDLLKYFHSSQSVTAWLGSIQFALMNVTGILAVPLIHRFGWRVTAITGAILSTIGFGTSALATNIYILYVTYGLLTGTGNGFMQLVSMVAVQQYFDKHRATANGIAISGAGIGILVYGVMTTYIVGAVGWQVMMLVNAGSCLVLGVTAGVLFRPLPYEVVKTPVVRQQERNIPKLQAIEESEEVDFPDDENLKLAMTISIHKSTRFNYGSLSGSYEVVESIPVRRSVLILTTVSSLVEDEELFDFEFLEFPLATESKIPVKIRRRYQAASHIQQAVAIMREMFDLNLMKDPVYVLFTFNMLMMTYAASVPLTFIPELAMTDGTPYSQASLLIPVVGLTSIFSRLFFGWLADILPKRRFDMVGSLFTVLGALELLTPCFIDYPSLVLYSALFGILEGALFTLYPVILLDLIGRGPFDQGLSLLLAITSIACVTAGPISGLIIDETGDVKDVRIPFMLVGGLQTIGAFAYFMIVCVQRTRKMPSIKESKLSDQAKYSQESLLDSSMTNHSQENDFEINQSHSSGNNINVIDDPESTDIKESDPERIDDEADLDSDNEDSTTSETKPLVTNDVTE